MSCDKAILHFPRRNSDNFHTQIEIEPRQQEVCPSYRQMAFLGHVHIHVKTSNLATNSTRSLSMTKCTDGLWEPYEPASDAFTSESFDNPTELDDFWCDTLPLFLTPDGYLFCRSSRSNWETFWRRTNGSLNNERWKENGGVGQRRCGEMLTLRLTAWRVVLCCIRRKGAKETMPRDIDFLE